ncbi:MAG: hypothetical protein P8P74_07620 [Crocinitomicaceae bacterium]|nr:hypothetical protein [Crocinitomicaceae bacterium]
MSNLSNHQRRLAEGTSSWLNYEFNCLRGELFSEKYLCTPIGQILTAIYPGRIYEEVDHPILNKFSKVGRPAQIDFAIKKDDEIKSVLESKWTGKSSLSFKQILWDLVRLEQMAYHYDVEAYFLLAGFAKKIPESLSQTHFLDGNDHASHLFTTKRRATISLKLNDLDDSSKTFLNNRIAKYKGLKVPTRMSFKFPHFYPKKTINMTFQTYVWHLHEECKQ